MPFTYNVPFFSIFLALLSAVSVPFLKNGEQALRMIRVVQAVVAALSAALLAHLWSGDSFTFMMGHFPAPWGNELRAGPLEALLALAFSLVMFLSLTGGAEDIRRDIREERQGQYCLLMQLLYAALLAMVYTNDLFTAYVFVEIAAVTACIAVVAKESGRSVVAAIRYLVFSCLGSGLILLGISMLYSVTGHLLMEDLGRGVAQLAQTGRYAIPLTASALLMTLGLAIKSAQFPFHAWLPDAHASATTASSAILSGLVLKGYIVLIIKLILRVFGSSVLIEMYLHDLLFLLGVAGMLFASVAALRQEEVKRMIAYSSSAQISYIFLALGLGSRAGTAAACFQLLTHAFTKPMIFVGAGALIRAGEGGHYWSDLRGMAWRAPVAGIGFTVGGLSLCGLPLLAGFSSKYSLAVAALAGEWQTMPTLFSLAVSSVLNAMYYIPAILVIWGRRDGERGTFLSAKEASAHRWATLCFVAFNLVLGVGVGPILALIHTGLALF
ncbi:complex I subunit 5 family protein [Muriventricola aceti]|uniref:complex I subunit 5 family protein n=1 Tax=Muriventricola aceti TaxID=2981773 RepID=UPI003EB937F3